MDTRLIVHIHMDTYQGSGQNNHTQSGYKCVPRNEATFNTLERSAQRHMLHTHTQVEAQQREKILECHAGREVYGWKIC